VRSDYVKCPVCYRSQKIPLKTQFQVKQDKQKKQEEEAKQHKIREREQIELRRLKKLADQTKELVEIDSKEEDYAVLKSKIASELDKIEKKTIISRTSSMLQAKESAPALAADKKDEKKAEAVPKAPGLPTALAKALGDGLPAHCAFAVPRAYMQAAHSGLHAT
jgi:hypothetical protein